MRLKKSIFMAVLLCVFANVNADEPVLNRNGQVGLINTYSAKNLGRSRMAFNIQGDFSADKSFLNSFIETYFDTSTEKYVVDTSSPEIALFSIRPSLAYGITSFIDLSLTLPIYLDILATQNTQFGIGDIEAGLKIGLPRKPDKKFYAALLSSFSFPTGSKDKGYFLRHPYYLENFDTSSNIYNISSSHSSRKTETELAALMTIDLKKFLFHLNPGVRFTYNKDLDEVFILGLGLEFCPLDYFTFFTEIKSETRFDNVKDGFKITDDPFRITPGVTFKTYSGATFTLAGSFKLSSEKELFYNSQSNTKKFSTKIEPAWQVILQIGWGRNAVARDSDKDMIPDEDDGCPLEAEDVDGFEDTDGCPDYDNDKDGVADSLDKCPIDPEDKDGFEDDDGCPEFDNDKDGVADSVDNCFDFAEDRDGFEDHDGCPEYDNDADGVPDSLDKCVNILEDKDGFEDDDGCPDIDNDVDGVPDSLDKCPDLVGVKEEGGCPKHVPKTEEIRRGRIILHGVKFDGGNSTLTLEAMKNLDSLYASLVDWPDIKLEIQGHTDNSGNSSTNLILSSERVGSICKYLIEKGISPDRLRVVGKGDTSPIGDNSSVHGRKVNNRIEIQRID